MVAAGGSQARLNWELVVLKRTLREPGSVPLYFSAVGSVETHPHCLCVETHAPSGRLLVSNLAALGRGVHGEQVHAAGLGQELAPDD